MDKLVGFLMGFAKGALLAGGTIVIIIVLLRLLMGLVGLIQADEPYTPYVAPVDIYGYGYGYPDPYLDALMDIILELDSIVTEPKSKKDKCRDALESYKYYTRWGAASPDDRSRAVVEMEYYAAQLEVCGYDLEVWAPIKGFITILNPKGPLDPEPTIATTAITLRYIKPRTD